MKDDAERLKGNMPGPVRAIYELWLRGVDVSPASGIISRATWYRYARIISEVTGHDIALDPPLEKGPSGTRDKLGKDWLLQREEKEHNK